MPTKTGPTLRTLETLLEEVVESSEQFKLLFRALKRTDVTNKKYAGILSELWAESEVLKVKADHAKQVIDEFEDLLPDDED